MLDELDLAPTQFLRRERTAKELVDQPKPVGIDDVDGQLARMVQQALPADVAKAEQLARERIEAIEHERRHAPPPAPLSDLAGQAPKRRKFRPMV